MRLFDRLVKRPPLRRLELPDIIQELDRRLEATREEFAFGTRSALRSEGVDVTGVPRLLERGTELDSALRAFQLTVCVGFAWKYLHLHPQDREPFDRLLTQRLDNGHPRIIDAYREVYLDCEGHIEALKERAAADIYRLWDAPHPREKIIRGLMDAVPVLAIISQAQTAAAMGERRTEHRLRQLVAPG